MGQVHDADLVLHVVDRSHTVWEEQQEVAREVLRDLDVEPERVILVHNKIDRLNGLRSDGNRPHATNGHGPEIFEVSATTGDGVGDLRRHLAYRLYGLSESATEDELWLQTATAG